jgi:hypothetical protein
MENTTIASLSAEAAQIIAETNACAAALSATIQRQNEVVLSYCQALIDQTLKTMSSLQSLEQSGSGSSASQNMEQLQSETVQAIKQSAETLKNVIPADMTNAVIKLPGGVDMLKNQPLQSFVANSSILFANAVAAQQQLNIITQAATVQTVNIILNMAAAAMSK